MVDHLKFQSGVVPVFFSSDIPLYKPDLNMITEVTSWHLLLTWNWTKSSNFLVVLTIPNQKFIVSYVQELK